MKISLKIFTQIILLSMLILAYGCKKATLPVVVTLNVTDVTLNSAVSGGEVTSDGGDDIISKGVCWNTTGEPTIADQKTSDGKGSTNFTSNISGLQQGILYHIRAYATNSAGTSYGEEFTFSTKIADVDGNKYSTIVIGSQMWTAENLKTTKYNDNSQIPNVTDNTEWTALTTAAYSWPQNNEELYKPLYGAYYNWFAVNSGKLCPTGWHVPTEADFSALEISLGMSQVQTETWDWRGTDQGKKMKNTSGWTQGENGTNTSGFSALPAGYRAHATGLFEGIGLITYWWTATEQNSDIAIYRRLDGNNDGVYKGETYKKAGKSIRCVKN